ncbi:MAG: hypothetical protein KGL95_15830, partial [Patescibacteria group bacterium]|nr:hypothetical protein [Patescibacteria group bacterium]
ERKVYGRVSGQDATNRPVSLFYYKSTIDNSFDAKLILLSLSIVLLLECIHRIIDHLPIFKQTQGTRRFSIFVDF